MSPFCTTVLFLATRYVLLILGTGGLSVSPAVSVRTGTADYSQKIDGARTFLYCRKTCPSINGITILKVSSELHFWLPMQIQSQGLIISAQIFRFRMSQMDAASVFGSVFARFQTGFRCFTFKGGCFRVQSAPER